jgi:peptide/nickel transport system substrate-binding protein
MVLASSAGAETSLKVAINGDIRSTQFGVNRDGTTDTVLHHVIEGLVAYRDDLSVGPLLAKSWEVSPDGTVYTFTLRDGALFHNGQPVTASDVKWSWERLLNPETKFVCRNWFDGTGGTGIKITSIETLDDKRVRFTLQEPNALFLSRMAHMVCLSGIIHKDTVGADGSWNNPIGTGPFTIKEWRKNQFIELAKFDRYVPLKEKADGYAGNREPKVDRVRFLVIADPAAAKAALLAGDIDVLTNLDLDAVEEVKGVKGIRVGLNITPGWEVMLMQDQDPLLKDKRIRQAIAHAINRDEIVLAATAGLGKSNPSAVAEKSSFFGSKFQRGLSYSPDKARQLLKEAGYKGEAIKLTSNAQYPFDNKSAIAIQSMLQSVGINVELEVLDWATQFKNYNEGRTQLMVMGFSARPDPTLMYDVFMGDRSKRKNVYYVDEKALEALAQSSTTADPEKRRQLFAQIHQRMVDDSSVMGLFNYVEADAFRPERVKGFEVWSLGKSRFWGVEVAK